MLILSELKEFKAKRNAAHKKQPSVQATKAFKPKPVQVADRLLSNVRPPSRTFAPPARRASTPLLLASALTRVTCAGRRMP